MPTIKDIAKLAGVSDTTVSNVIHNRSNVSTGTAEKIKKIMKELSYSPNLNARSLHAKSAPLIACIYSSVNMTANSLYLSRLITSLEKVLFANGLYLIVKTVDIAENITKLFNMWNLKGLIVIGNFEDSIIADINTLGIPVMCIDSIIEKNYNNIYTVNIDDYLAAYNATEYLISLGHQNIAFVSHGISGSRTNKARFEGYLNAMNNHNTLYDPSFFYEICPEAPTNDLPPAMEIGKKIAQSSVTAVFSASDMLAWDVILGIQTAGKSVPSDISVMGFDDMFICSRISPSLSTVHNSSYTKGTTSGQLLIDVLNGKDVNHRTIIPTHLVIRNSTNNYK